MATAGSIVISLMLASGSFSTDTARSAKDLEKIKKAAYETGRALGDAFKGIAGKLGIGLGLGELASMIKATIDAADHLNDLSKNTGIAVEHLGGLGFAAGQAGGDLDSIAAAAGKLNKHLAEAGAGNKEAQQSFDALGISVKDVDGRMKSADKVMVEIAEKFKGFADGPNKSALALAYFDKAGANVISMLNDGGAALQESIEYYQRFAGTTAETAQAADQFNDTMGKFSLVMGTFGRELTAELLPGLQAVAERILGIAENSQLGSIAVAILKTTFEAVAVVGANVAHILDRIGNTIGGIAAQMVALGHLDIKGFHAINQAIIEDNERATKSLAAFEARVLGFNKGLGEDDRRELARRGRKVAGFGGLPEAPSLPKLPAAAAGPKVSEAQRYLESLQKQAEKTEKMTNLERVLNDIQKKRIDGLTPALEKQVIAQAKLLDQLDYEAQQRKNVEDALQKGLEDRLRSADAATSEAKALLDDNDALKLEIQTIGASTEARFALEQARLSSAIAVAMDRLQTLKSTDAIGLETQAVEDQIEQLQRRKMLLGLKQETETAVIQAKQADWLGGARTSLTSYLDMVKDVNQQTEGLFTNAFQGMEDALTNFVMTGKLNFKDLANSIISDIARIMIRQNITGPLANMLMGAFSGPTNFGGINGGAMLPNSLRGGAAGGTNMLERDMVTLVHKGEAIIPKAYNPAVPGGANGAGQPMKVTIHNNGGGDVKTNQIGPNELEVIINAAVQRVDRNLASGTGSTAQALKSRGVSLDGALPRRA